MSSSLESKKFNFLIILLVTTVCLAVLILAIINLDQSQNIQQKAAAPANLKVPGMKPYWNNPGQGLFQCHANNAAGINYVKGGAVEVYWGQLQPDSQDSLNQSALDRLVSLIKESGKVVYLRFAVYPEPNKAAYDIYPRWLNLGENDSDPFNLPHPDIQPDALANAKESDKIKLIYLPDVQNWPNLSYIPYPAPWDSDYHNYLKNFLILLNEAFEEKGVKKYIEYIEPAMGGMHGSTHLYYAGHPEKMNFWGESMDDILGVDCYNPQASAANRVDGPCFGQHYTKAVNDIVSVYADSFPDIPQMIIGGSCHLDGASYNGLSSLLNKYGMRVMFKMAGLGANEGRCGLRTHYFTSICSGSSPKTKCGQETFGQGCGNASFNPQYCSGFGDNNQAVYENVYQASLAEETVSYYCMYSGDLNCNQAFSQVNQVVANNLGAQIKITDHTEINNQSKNVGEELNLDISWQNNGSAPLIAPLKKEVKWEPSSYKLFIEFEKDSEVVHYQELDIEPPTNSWGWSGGQTTTSFTIPISSALGGADGESQNTYQVFVGLTDPNEENERFALTNSNNNDLALRRYRLANAFFVNGEGPEPTPRPKRSDLNNDGVVDEVDYGIIITNFGRSDQPAKDDGDINSDGRVDEVDYAILIVDFGQ